MDNGIRGMLALRMMAAALCTGGMGSGHAAPYGEGATESTIDPAVMQIDEAAHLGAPVDRDYLLVDGNGTEFRLGDLLGKPLILVLSYYGCDGACPTLNRSLGRALAQVDRFRIGADYRVLTVSFDRLDKRETIAGFLAKAGGHERREGWYHAVLRNPEADIDRLTGSVGFRYFWSRADQVFLHPNAVMFLTPTGRVARYLYGTAIDRKGIELALIDADWERISNTANVIDVLSGVCYSYSFADGKYTVNYSLVVGLASLVFGIVLVALSALGFHRKRVGRWSHV